MRRRASGNALLAAGLGFLLVTSLPPSVRPRGAGLTPAGFGAEQERDPARMNFRDLQRLPCIGPARARAIVEERHRRGALGGVRAWDAIRGIGPGTLTVLEALLQQD